MQDGVPTSYIKVRFYIIIPLTRMVLLHPIYCCLQALYNTMSMTTRNNQNKKVTTVKYIIYNMNHRSI